MHLFEIQSLCENGKRSFHNTEWITQSRIPLPKWIELFSQQKNLLFNVSDFLASYHQFLNKIDLIDLREAFSTPKNVSGHLISAIQRVWAGYNERGVVELD